MAIYGIKQRTCGVYLIKNKITGDCYVGASINVNARLSTHFGRDAKKYTWRQFYKDVREFGRDGFNWELLEECDPNNLLEREQFWYDTIKPTYNFDRPTRFPSDSEKILKLTKSTERYFKAVEDRKVLYNTEEYRNKFREIQRERFCPVAAFKDNELIKEFESYSDCSRWINKVTCFKSKNKASKIREVCIGERPSAFGFTFNNV